MDEDHFRINSGSFAGEAVIQHRCLFLFRDSWGGGDTTQASIFYLKSHIIRIQADTLIISVFKNAYVETAASPRRLCG